MQIAYCECHVQHRRCDKRVRMPQQTCSADRSCEMISLMYLCRGPSLGTAHRYSVAATCLSHAGLESGVSAAGAGASLVASYSDAVPVRRSGAWHHAENAEAARRRHAEAAHGIMPKMPKRHDDGMPKRRMASC